MFGKKPHGYITYSLMLEGEKISETYGCESKLIWLFTQKGFITFIHWGSFKS
jgi:hypothetical protein